MATTAIRQEVDELREYMKELSYQSLRTEMSLNRLSEELRELKDEMRAFKDEAERDRKRMNKQWGDLANRLGTLVEDPEHAGKRLVGVLATLYPDDSVIRRATAAGVLVMGMGDEAMQVMNPDALETRDPA